MHEIQQKLLELSRRQNLAKLSLRQMAVAIGLPSEAPQQIKHHLSQLQRKGFLTIDKPKGVMERAELTPGWAKGILTKASKLFSIPIVGTANCGPATIFAESNFEGFLKVSSKLVGRSRPNGLYAVRTDGSSMNRAQVGDKTIEDGDLVIVDSNRKNARTNDIVLAIIDSKATIKRFIDDREHGQIVLKADSAYDYEPIFLHPDDDFAIAGEVVSVLKKPR